VAILRLIGMPGEPGVKRPDQRDELPPLAERDRGGQQAEAADPVGGTERGLQGDPAAEAVADEHGRVELEAVEEADEPSPEERGVVGVAHRLARPVPWQVGRDHPVVLRQLDQRRQERSVGGAEPVHEHDRRRVPWPGFEVCGADACRQAHPGSRMAVRQSAVVEDAVELQGNGEVAANRQLPAQESLRARAATADHVAQDIQRGRDSRRRPPDPARSSSDLPAADADAPAAVVAGVEHDSCVGPGQHGPGPPAHATTQQGHQVAWLLRRLCTCVSTIARLTGGARHASGTVTARHDTSRRSAGGAGSRASWEVWPWPAGAPAQYPAASLAAGCR